MKVILTGATGFIGSEVLHQLLQHANIDSVISLSRRKPDVEDRKLTVLIVEDFTNIPREILKACADADACIWALGSADFKNLEASTRINLDFTIAGARALADTVGDKNFRLVYTSGVLAVREQESRPWFLGEGRKMRVRHDILPSCCNYSIADASTLSLVM